MAQSPDVPAYLQPAFHSIDSQLSGQQRDSLRSLPLDSAFRYRNYELRELTKHLEDDWLHSPIVDTVVAHGEQTYMTGEIVLDLYHQHLRHEPLDLTAAIRRISPAYVDSILPHTVAIDSVFLEEDLDGSSVADHLVRLASRRHVEVDGQSNSGTYQDTVGYAEYRLALYLDAAPLRSRPPAWLAQLEERDGGGLVKSIALPAGGTLLVLDIASADAGETVILLVRHGEAREILHHQIDYGEGNFEIREGDGRVEVDVTGDVQLAGRNMTSEKQCAPTEWPGTTLLYDESAHGFVPQRAICMRRL